MITRKEYQNSKKRNNIDDDFIKRDEPVEDEPLKRTRPDEKKGNAHDLTAEQKTKRLGRRLNWAIAFLILAIIVVYLILIYVNP